MLNNPYYKKQIENECQAIINYSRNGSIEDVDLSEFLPQSIMETLMAGSSSKEIE